MFRIYLIVGSDQA